MENYCKTLRPFGVKKPSVIHENHVYYFSCIQLPRYISKQTKKLRHCMKGKWYHIFPHQ